MHEWFGFIELPKLIHEYRPLQKRHGRTYCAKLCALDSNLFQWGVHGIDLNTGRVL